MDKSKKEMRNAWRKQHRATERDKVPISSERIEQLFDHLDQQLEAADCDHTLRFTIGFLTSHGIADEPVVEWLAEHGGYCDCEVLGNVGDYWESIRERSGRPNKADV